MGRLDRWEAACLALILAGLGLRAWHLGGHALEADAAWYATMARTLAEDGRLLVPWAAGAVPTHHFPPLYPAFGALFVLAVGPTMLAVKLTSFAAAALFVAAVFLATRDLYGRRAAFAVTTVAATLPTLVAFDWSGLSETFVAMLFALTVWGILKSLDEPRYIVFAGLFAGLGYLAKASMGPFFLLAGAAGFAWRFAYVRWRVFQDKWYLLAAAIFACFVVPWALRNLRLHGTWETQPQAGVALAALFARGDWPLVVLGAALWTLLLVTLQCAPFLPGLRTARVDLRAERTTGLIMAIVTPILVASFFVAGFSVAEGYSIVFDPDDHPMRYAITPIVPLLWLAMRRLPFDPQRPPGEPTAGAHLLRRERLFLVAGGAVLALTLAFRHPHELATQTVGAAVLLVLGMLVGIVLLGVARACAWEPIRREGAAMSWRAVRVRARAWPYSLAFVLLLAALFAQEVRLPLLLAASAAALAATWRHRVVVVGIVLLGWSLGGSMWAWPGTEVDSALPEDATLAVAPGHEPWFYPFLPEGRTMVPWDANATHRVVPIDADAPPGYHLVSTFGRFNDHAPAAWARLKLQQLEAGGHIGDPWRTFALYEANATA